MAERTAYTVTFDRIGRNRAVPPLETASADADHLAEQIYVYARPYLLSSNVDVHVDLTVGKGSIFCGFNNGGTFTIEAADA